MHEYLQGMEDNLRFTETLSDAMVPFVPHLEEPMTPDSLFTFGAVLCAQCGVKSVGNRDYMPTTHVIRLKPDTRTTYIVTPEVERLAMHIRGLDSGKLNYAFDVPLQDHRALWALLDTDTRIEEWHTVVLDKPNHLIPESAVVCGHHFGGTV